MSVSIALIHYPVTDKKGKVAATSITNFDIHDLARTARTYNVDRFYIVSPMPSQKGFAQRIIQHWREGFGSSYNPSRGEALEIAVIVNDLLEVVDDLTERSGGNAPVLVGTSAKFYSNSVTFNDLRERIKNKEKDYCIIFGTGWGLHPSLLLDLDLMLEPVNGAGDYNHLSVRAAVAIITDRLLGS
jgi:hypothetical protein